VQPTKFSQMEFVVDKLITWWDVSSKILNLINVLYAIQIKISKQLKLQLQLDL